MARVSLWGESDCGGAYYYILATYPTRHGVRSVQLPREMFSNTANRATVP